VWTHPPELVEHDGPDLLVTAVDGSDVWRHTSYGFVHDSEHALVAPLATDMAVEVAFTVDLHEQFDQAGVFLQVSATHWVKAGVEHADGVPQLGVVVTDGRSDWSVAPVAAWAGRRATIRASRSGDAVTVRARVDDEPFALVRLLPLAPDLDLRAGPFLCSPTRSGLTVRFHSWRTTDPDAALH
jgi:regulation of enolase protein 1 (concanavalin A-like superfamily)